MTLKEGFTGAHEQVPDGPKVGAIAELLGKNVRAVDFAGNVFYLYCKVLLLAFVDKVLSEIEIIEAFFRCCFLPVAACRVVVVDNGG